MIAIENATIQTFGKVGLLTNAVMLIDGGFITKIGSAEEVKVPAGTPTIDASGCLVMPGLINAHTHLYSSLARGMPAPDKAPRNFGEILQRVWWRLDKALDEESIRYSALIGALDSLRCGTTTIFDHHASQNCIDGSLDIIAEVLDEIGIRGCLCYEVSDRDGRESTHQGIRENKRFIRRCLDLESSSLRAKFGLHASFTISNSTLEKCSLSEGMAVGFHSHFAEDEIDEFNSIERYGQKVAKRFQYFKILRPGSIMAHGVDLDRGEIKILRDSGAFLAHNPQSNMNNAVGVAAIPQMLDMGIPVGLGTDGYTPNLFEEMRALSAVHKLNTEDPGAMGFDKINRIVFKNNSRLAEETFKIKMGVLEPGAVADIIILRYEPPTPMSTENFFGHLFFGICPNPIVDTVIINGKIIIQDSQFVSLDVTEIMPKARDVAKKLWKRMS